MIAQRSPSWGFDSIADDLAAALDPVLFARHMGIDPDPWQAEVLRSGADRALLNCSRQSGKSTITATLALHTAIYEPGSLILLLSPSQRQSAELFRKLARQYMAIGATVPPKAESALRLELENGSRVISLPATEATIRGYSEVDLLLIDEASRVKSELYHAVRPMLAVSRGRLFAMSTPWGTRGWWYEAWRSDDDWLRMEIPASMCPRISPDFLEEERRNLGSYFFEQEYMCAFLDAETSAFSTRDIDAAFVDDLEEWEL